MIALPRPLPRRLYYGWVLVWTLALTELVSWGVLYYAFAVLVPPMEADLGWSRTRLTAGFSLALAVAGVAAIPVGRWLDRHGARLLMTAGSVLATLLVLAWSTVDSPWAYYLLWVGLGLAMAATLYEPAFVVVANWFVRRRGRALTILTFVAGFASVVFIPLTQWLVRELGWREALVVLAAILAATTIPPHALLLRRRPEDLGLLPDGEGGEGGFAGGRRGAEERKAPDPPEAARPAPPEAKPTPPATPSVTTRDALRGAPFWWLTAAFTLAMLAFVAVTVHLIPYLTDAGFDPAFAASAAGLIGAVALPGRLVFTPLGGILPRRYVTASLFLLLGVALVVLRLAEGEAGVLLFVFLFGAGFGAVTPARAALVAERYGAANFGAISAVLGLFVTGARAVAPVGVSLLVDLTGGYGPVLWGLAVLGFLAAAAVVLAGESRPRES